MPDADVVKFREIVLADRSLQDRLRQPEERAEFVETAVLAALECGISLTSDDIENALRNGRREWIERWI